VLLLFHSSKSGVPVWPFLSASFFGGIYALLPYFVLWKPPPPPVEEAELKTWPLNFLESKVAAMVSCSSQPNIVKLLQIDHCDLNNSVHG
jgi:hypothetical protein